MILGLVERRHPLALEAVPAGSRRRGSRRRSRDGSGDGIRGAIHITGTESIERWFRDVTDSAANVSSIFAVASVGHSITVIQALARLLVITCFLEARFPGTPDAVPGGWLVNEFIEFVLACDILILVGFERKDLSQRNWICVIRSWGRRGGASCKINLACACVAS